MQEMKVDELLMEAGKSYVEGRIYDAVLYFETVLEMEEGNYTALTMLSKIYADAEFYKDALKYCEMAYEKYGENLEIIFNMGYMNQSIGKYKKALSFYKEYMAREENYHVMLNMGICSMELKYYKKALEFFDGAIRKDPDNSEGYLDKAECLTRMKQFDRAMEILEGRLSDIQNNIEEYYIYMRMAELKSEAGNLNKAIEYYNIAISFENAESFVYEGFYDMLLRNGRYDDIELLLLNYRNRSDKYLEALSLEGRYASQMKDFERAEKVCERLLIIDPENPLHYFNFAYVSEMMNDYDKALEYIKKAAEYIEDKEMIKSAENRLKKARADYIRSLKKSF